MKIDIGELSISYKFYKNGPNTIVFLHGNSTGKEVFNQQFIGLRNSGFSLLALDLSGHGESSNSTSPKTDYTFPSLAKLVQALLAKLSIQNPLVVGWSLGGHILIEMAGQGYKMAGGAIMGTPPLGPGVEDVPNAFLQTKALEVAFKTTLTEEDITAYLGAVYGSLFPIPEIFRELAKRTDGVFRLNVSDHWSCAEDGFRQKDVVANWEKPLWVLHGEDDQLVSGKYLRNLTYRNLWKNNVMVLEGIGHAPFLEAPEVFNNNILEFAKEIYENCR